MQDNRFSDGGDWEQQTHSNEQINKSPGFFFWHKKTEIQWLQDFLPKTSITDASICCVLHPPGEDWKSLAWRSSPIILCHSFSTNTEWTCLEEFLTHCRALPGKRVIVIITDVKDSGSEKSIQEEWGKWKFSGFELVTLTCQEINFISTYISKDISPERKMARKIHILKNILQINAERRKVVTKRSKFSREKTTGVAFLPMLPQTEHKLEKYKIGIFSRSDSSEYSWLVKLLTSENFSGRVLSATQYYIANNQFEKFKNDVSQCTFGILYHTKNSGRINVTNVTSSLYDEELKHLHEKLGRDNVIVVIDDLEESTDQVKDQILKEQHSIKEWARDLFIFCQEEKKTDPHIIPSMKEKMKHLEAMITDSTGCFLASTSSTGQCVASSTRQRTSDFPDSSRENVQASAGLPGQRPFASNVFTTHSSSFLNNSSTSQAQRRESVEKYKIGIFSRSDSSEYSWLVKLLTSENFSGRVLSATQYYIANNQFEKFKDDVSQCTFGILYHTKNSGRINVTNVTSSLYDEELKHLHEKLGRDNVIVVIDDLEESTDQVKDQILKEQHSIEKWARDLFIFCQEEKKTDPHIIPSMEEKMKHLEAMITDSTGCFLASTSSTGQCVASLTRQSTPVFPDSSRQNVQASAGLTGQRPFASNVFTALSSSFPNNFSTSQAQSMESDSTGCFLASTSSTGQCVASSTRQSTSAFPNSSRENVKASASLPGQRPFASNVSTTHSSSFLNNSSTSQAQSRESGFNSGKEKSTEKKRSQSWPSITQRILTVGIFSVTEDTEYNWLKSLLGKRFRNVRSFYISFSRFHQFQNDLSQCTHGILYHTKNRGRINVTDVTDSLYDKHLKHMSDTLGKNRVIVVLDDLDDNSDKMRKTVLQEQPKIRQLARDLFLVKNGTDQQKMSYFEHNRKPDFS